MKRGTPDHPKTLALQSALACSRAEAVGILELLWHWTARYAPAGDVGRWTNGALAVAIGWAGNPDEFVAALVAARWLDESAECRLYVHDWAQHADDAVHIRLARAGRKFADGTDPSGRLVNRLRRVDPLGGELDRAARYLILDRDSFTCRNCGSSLRMTVDHIVPIASGGTHAEENLQALCSSCNSKKGTR